MHRPEPLPSDFETRIGSASGGRTFVQVLHKPTGTERHQVGLNGESTDAVARKLYLEVLVELAGDYPKDS